MIETIQFKGREYPAFQASGFAARFAFPFAKELCKGLGYDIGCNRPEWCFPGAYPVDPLVADWPADWHTKNDFPSGFPGPISNGLDLPDSPADYIFSSHCLEHLPDWVAALSHWESRLRVGGVLFLYLPHPDQEYWKPWNNRKHIHALYPEMIEKYLKENVNFTKVFVSGRDLNHSYYAIAQKRK